MFYDLYSFALSLQAMQPWCTQEARERRPSVASVIAACQLQPLWQPKERGTQKTRSSWHNWCRFDNWAKTAWSVYHCHDIILAYHHHLCVLSEFVGSSGISPKYWLLLHQSTIPCELQNRLGPTLLPAFIWHNKTPFFDDMTFKWPQSSEGQRLSSHITLRHNSSSLSSLFSLQG